MTEILKRLRILDSKGRVSLTNLLLVLSLVLISVGASATYASVVLTLAVLNYNASKAWEHFAKDESRKVSAEPGAADLENMKARISKLELKAGFEGR